MSDPVTRLNAALEGRYAIERELGEGGMATVYLADDLKHQRKVALKPAGILSSRLLHSPAALVPAEGCRLSTPEGNATGACHERSRDANTAREAICEIRGTLPEAITLSSSSELISSLIASRRSMIMSLKIAEANQSA